MKKSKKQTDNNKINDINLVYRKCGIDPNQPEFLPSNVLHNPVFNRNIYKNFELNFNSNKTSSFKRF